MEQTTAKIRTSDGSDFFGLVFYNSRNVNMGSNSHFSYLNLCISLYLLISFLVFRSIEEEYPLEDLPVWNLFHILYA
ncbi:hypothetical protein E2R56_19275 [Rhodococcus qingshengii]|nr:hypothetical protein E2R56_19275 [Rhodococcus qingshengii]